MKEKELDYMMLKCIKKVIESDNYDDTYQGYTTGEEKYTENDIFMIDSYSGNRYLKYYPDCFEKIEMEKEDWIGLAKERIKFAKYALIGRNTDDGYFNTFKEHIQDAEDLILNGLKTKEELNKLLHLIKEMPVKQSMYWYDTLRETPLHIIKAAYAAFKAGITTEDIDALPKDLQQDKDGLQQDVEVGHGDKK